MGYDAMQRLRALVYSLDQELANLHSIYTANAGADLSTDEQLFSRIEQIFQFTKIMSLVIGNSANSIFVVDQNGTAIMINNAFEVTTGIKPDKLIGRTVMDLEKAGYFWPSVLHLALSEKRPVSILQAAANSKYSVAKGVPVLDEAGNVIIGVSNAQLVEEIQQLYRYVENQEHLVEHASDILIGSSPMMKSAIELIEQVKDTGATILISGESGVGKGVFSRYIHKNSNRAEGPMIEINCGAIPEHLFESELFGYESGAFTGASKAGKPGLIEAADGGTLLLDEISEMPLMLQVKLLKVIQDKKVTRIGGKTAVDVDVRIIAASNKDLFRMVQEGGFRADLYYRLNVIPFYLPALRERPADIPHAARFFTDKSNVKYNKDVVCSEEFSAALTGYDWPGNMRELENYIERKVLTNRSGFLLQQDAEDIAPSSGQAEQKQEYSDESVLALYDKYRSSYKVAEALGVSQSSAYRMIRKARQSAGR